MSDAVRINNVVQAYEGGRRDRKPSSLPRAPGNGGVLRLCKTICPFPKNSKGTVEIWEEGTPPNETISSGETLEDVVNKYADIETGKFVSVAAHGNGYFYIVAADCG